jgi:hypothetical protein
MVPLSQIGLLAGLLVSVSSPNPKMRSMTLPESQLIAGLYDVLFTSDENFCDPSQIMADADC